MKDFDPSRILAYKPNQVGAGVSTAVFIGLGLAFLFWPKRLVARRQWFYLALPIGSLLTGLGWAGRIYYANSPSLAAFITQELLIVVSPALFFAFNCACSWPADTSRYTKLT